MSNDSSTGGILDPSADPAPLEGKLLYRFFQQWIVGISGLDGKLVRPSWQGEPPNLPDDTEVWAAIAIRKSGSDTYPWVGHVDTGSSGGADELQRHEELEVLISFYGLGSESEADAIAARTRDGVVIDQNREPLLEAGMGLVEARELIQLPTLLKLRWLYRVDLPIVIRRAVVRRYEVKDIASAEIELMAETPGGELVVDETINATN